MLWFGSLRRSDTAGLVETVMSTRQHPHPDDDSLEPELLEGDGDEEGEPLEEEEATGPVCGACRREIVQPYFLLASTPFCAECRGRVETSLTGSTGRAGRIFRAALFGGLAGAAGCLVYYAVLKLLDMQIGVISILVGFMVGTAVAKGSERRGGWFYQLLAIFLTYTAIAASFSAAILPELIKGFEERRVEAEKLEKQELEAEKGQKAGDVAAEKVAAANPKDAPPPTLGEAAAAIGLLLVMAIGLMFAFPILAGIQSPLTFLIVGFALWEAWKLNRRAKIVWNGPYLPDGRFDQPVIDLA